MQTKLIAARRAFVDPSIVAAPTEHALSERDRIYRERLMRAQNGAYEDLSLWRSRFDSYELYRRTRDYVNPLWRLGQFYASQVYPGMIPQGEEEPPKGAREAFPLDPHIDPALKMCIRQVAQWGNLQTMKSLIPRRGASLGDAGLLEVVDDVASGKVRWRLWWPGLITDLDLSPYGDVRGYVLEYEAWDRERKESFRYRYEITRDEIRETRDGEPWSLEGIEAATRPNPYGFVPACWVRHSDNGTSWGDPAALSDGKIDLLNSLVSRTVDYIRTRMKSPQGLAADIDPRGTGDMDLRAQFRASEDEAADEFSGTYGGGDTDDVYLLYLPPGTSAVPLSGNIEPEQAMPIIDKLLNEIENDNPELSAWNKLREMSSVSGVAIERALGDTAGRLAEAQATYDQQFVKAFQMSVAIAGWRARSGAWGPRLTAAQEKFLEFDLESYDAGELDFMILPRPLVPETFLESMEAKTARYNALSAAKAAGVSVRDAALELGWSEEDAERMAREDEEREARRMQASIAGRVQALRPIVGEARQLPPAPVEG